MLSLEGEWRGVAEGAIWSRIAFVTRYGHIGYTEAMTMPLRDLLPYSQALAKLLRDEAKSFTP